MRRLAISAFAAMFALGLVGLTAAQALHPAVIAATEPGAKAWEKHCHGCHDLAGALGAPPPRTVIGKMSADDVYSALVDGNMKAVGDTMGEDERQQVAMHVTAKPLSFVLEAEKPKP